jgi:endonuclease-3
MNKTIRAKAIFERFAQASPQPKTELIYQTPFELLVAVMLSAQATDKMVNKITSHLFKVANTPEAILNLGEDKLKDYICSINYYPTKAKHIIKTCEKLVCEHQGQVPSTRVDLEALPGIGRKTANIILNIIFGAPEIAVDTHIFRVCNRTGLSPGKTPKAVEENLLKVVPSPYLHDAHHWLVLHGRYICKARQPLCQNCLIRDLCQWQQKS